MSRTRSLTHEPIAMPSSLRIRSRNVGGAWLQWSNVARAPYHSLVNGSKSMTDRKTPGFFRAVREGGLIPTSPMSAQNRVLVASPAGGSLTVREGAAEHQVECVGQLRGTAALPAPPTLPEIPWEPAMQQALARAQMDAWDALTFLAEFRSTLETIIGFRQRADRLYDRLAQSVNARSRAKKGLDRAQIASEVWLELRYAWRPMLYDMQDIMEAIQRLQAGITDPLHRAYGTAESEVQRVDTVVGGNFQVPGYGGVLGWSMFAVRQTRKVSVRRSHHAAVGVQVTTRDITAMDPLVTAWELVPFSFILDWFVTIGDILAAFSPFATGQLRYATIAPQLEVITEHSHLLIPSASATYVAGETAPFTTLWTETFKSRRDESPKPTLAVDVNLDAFKIFDLIALWFGFNQKHLRRILRPF